MHPASDRRPTLPCALLLALVLSSACELPPPHESVTLTNAPTSKARALTITDGELALEFLGKLEREASQGSGRGQSGTGKWRFYVVPIVPAGWTKDQPIHAWATCHQHEDTAEACRAYLDAHQGPLRGSVAVHHNHSGTKKSGWETAIRTLEAEQGLVSVDAGAVIRLGDDG